MFTKFCKYVVVLNVAVSKSLKDCWISCQNSFQHTNHALDIHILLLQKGVYSYEYTDDWEKFNKTSLPEKEEFFPNQSIIHMGEYLFEAIKQTYWYHD